MPRDAQALAKKRANGRRPLFRKAKKIVPRISQARMAEWKIGRVSYNPMPMSHVKKGPIHRQQIRLVLGIFPVWHKIEMAGPD
jgi:hypothetical protein